MEFLKNEVKKKQRISLDKGHKQATPVKEAVRRRTKARTSTGDDDDILTAAGLHVADKVYCLFCEWTNESRDYFRAQDMWYGWYVSSCTQAMKNVI